MGGKKKKKTSRRQKTTAGTRTEPVATPEWEKGQTFRPAREVSVMACGSRETRCHSLLGKHLSSPVSCLQGLLWIWLGSEFSGLLANCMQGQGGRVARQLAARGGFDGGHWS